MFGFRRKLSKEDRLTLIEKAVYPRLVGVEQLLCGSNREYLPQVVDNDISVSVSKTVMYRIEELEKQVKELKTLNQKE